MAVFTLPRAGIDTWALYGAESTFGTAASSIQNHFGIVQSVTPNNRRNVKQIRGFVGDTTSGRNMVKALGGKFETSLTIEFQPQHFDWFKFVIGTRTGSGTSADKYVYQETVTGTTDGTTADKLVDSSASFDSDTLVNQRILNTTDGTQTTITAVDSGTQLSVAQDIFESGEDYTILADNLASMSISTNLELGTDDREWRYLGMKVNSCTIRSAVDEPVSVSLELVGADVDQSTDLTAAQSLDSADVYHFDGSSVEIPNGTSVDNIIDSLEITINNNVEVLYGLGSYVGQAGVPKNREYQIRFTMKTRDNTFTDYFLGSSTDVSSPTEIGTVEVTLTGGTNHNAEFLFSNGTIDEWADAQTHPDVVPEEFTVIAESLQVSEQQSA